MQGQYLHMTQLSEKVSLGRLGHGVGIPVVAEVSEPHCRLSCLPQPLCAEGRTHLPLESSNFVNIVEVLQAVTSKVKRQSPARQSHDIQPLLPHLPMTTSQRNMDIFL